MADGGKFMNIMVFDTETISVGKPYCYNIGYVIYDTDGKQIVCKRDFVVEQVWNNRPLFDTAYYADKRPIYVSRMRGRQTEMSKYGFIQSQMIRDIRNYKVDGAYAFNSKFDDNVFEFNADRYGCRNALDTLPIFDIRGYAMEYLADGDYKDFCDKNADIKAADGTSKKFITDADGYKTTAESFYSFLTNNADYNEEHTALEDSLIELEILKACISRGAAWQTEYVCPRSMPRNSQKTLTIKVDGEVDYQVNYTKKTERKVADGVTISLS